MQAFGTTRYRSPDDIARLRLMVTLKRVSGVPMRSSASGWSEENEALQLTSRAAIIASSGKYSFDANTAVSAPTSVPLPVPRQQTHAVNMQRAQTLPPVLQQPYTSPTPTAQQQQQQQQQPPPQQQQPAAGSFGLAAEASGNAGPVAESTGFGLRAESGRFEGRAPEPTDVAATTSGARRRLDPIGEPTQTAAAQQQQAHGLQAELQRDFAATTSTWQAPTPAEAAARQAQTTTPINTPAPHSAVEAQNFAATESYTIEVGWQQKVFGIDELRAYVEGTPLLPSSDEDAPTFLMSCLNLNKGNTNAAPAKQSSSDAKPLTALERQELERRLTRELTAHVKECSSTGVPAASVLHTYVNDEVSVRMSLEEDAARAASAITTHPEGEFKQPRNAKAGGVAALKSAARNMLVAAHVDGVEVILCQITSLDEEGRAFEARPALAVPGQVSNTGGQPYTFQTPNGSVWEYTLVANSAPAHGAQAASHAEAHEKARSRAAAAMAAPVAAFEKLPIDKKSAFRLAVFMEIVSAAGFENGPPMYVEWEVRLPSRGWSVANAVAGAPLKGVSHVGVPQYYPGDLLASDPSPLPVSHFGHPVELAFDADGKDHQDRSAGDGKRTKAAPCSESYPVMFFRLVSYDGWDRTSTKGYGVLRLDDSICPGTCERKLKTWRPFCGALGGLQEAFVGGGVSELSDMGYLDVPASWKELNIAQRDQHKRQMEARGLPDAPAPPAKALSRLGFQAQSGGELKVRINSVVQRHLQHGGPSTRRRTRVERLGLTSATTTATKEQKARRARDLPARPMSLNAIVERAKIRLREARGVTASLVGASSR
ncbi:ciliary basal body-associated protein [Pseudoscourfieldia marina]